jgi:3-hydroxybutyryl-CoA dehydrogenase
MPEFTLQEPEFYPFERILIAGPIADVLPLADRARQAGHTAALLLSPEEAAENKTSYRILTTDDPLADDEFDIAFDLYCTDLQAKAEALYYFEDSLDESVPILSLTIAISTSELARELLMPERFLGVSLLPPFAETSFAELMPCAATQKAVMRTAERFFESLNLKTAKIADSPGGVLARTVCCMINEAAFALQDRITSAEQIDKAMLLSLDLPNGLLQWAEKIGIEKVAAVMDGLYSEFKEERYRIAPLLKRLIRASSGFPVTLTNSQ